MERKVYEVGIVEGDRLFALMVTDQKKKANLLQTEIISKAKLHLFAPLTLGRLTDTH